MSMVKVTQSFLKVNKAYITVSNLFYNLMFLKTNSIFYTYVAEMSESLISLFSKPVVAEHTGGHYVACSGVIKDAYQDFLQDRYEELVDNDDKAAPDGKIA